MIRLYIEDIKIHIGSRESIIKVKKLLISLIPPPFKPFLGKGYSKVLIWKEWRKLKEEGIIDKSKLEKEDLPLVSSSPTGKDKKLTVSLTSHGFRIETVHLVIKKLAHQTMKPNRIVLWLAEDEFSLDTIPKALAQLRERGLEIGFCEDIGSYTKLIPTLKKYPDDLIITIDDDRLYPDYLIEKLYKSYLKESDVVHCYWARRMTFDEKKKLKLFSEWGGGIISSEASFDVFSMGYGGTLYFPGCFPEEVFLKDIFMKLSPTEDDGWFKAMLLKNGVKVRVIEREISWYEEFFFLPGSQDVALWKINMENDRKRTQIEAIFDYFDVWDKLNVKSENE